MSRSADKFHGEEFQDHVQRCLWRDGFPVTFYSSRGFQLHRGEGPVVECKLDRQLRKTGNVYFEICELRRGSDSWSESGIYRGDETWLWAVGDFAEFFLIAKSTLIALHKEKRFNERDTRKDGDTPTRGMLMPLAEVRRWAARRYCSTERDVSQPLVCACCHRACEEILACGACPDCTALWESEANRR